MRGRLVGCAVMRAALILVFLAGAGGCVSTGGKTAWPDQTADLSICCKDPERIPPALIDAFRPLVPEVGKVFAHVNWRKGYMLKQEEAHAALRAELQPLDVLVESSKGRITGHTIPGLFTHTMIYLGSEAELKRAGVWDSREIRPYQAEVKNGAIFVEADHDGVHLSDEDRGLNADRVVVLRPKHLTAARRAKALRDYFTAIGMPFDYYFDVTTPDRTFCAELVSIVMPELHLPVTKLYGIKMILPEAVPASALEGKSALTVISYTRATPKGWERVGPAELRADIAAAWAPKTQKAAARQR